MDNIVMFVCKLAVYVMQLLHVRHRKYIYLMMIIDDDDVSCRPLL